MTPYSMNFSTRFSYDLIKFQRAVCYVRIKVKHFEHCYHFLTFLFSLPLYVFTTSMNATEHFVVKSQWRALFRSIVK